MTNPRYVVLFYRNCDISITGPFDTEEAAIRCAANHKEFFQAIVIQLLDP